MNAYTSEQLRNVVLLGHSGAGKTMLGEAMLFASGVTNRLGRVEDGNTVSDYDAEEHARTYSISLSVLPVEWAGQRLNIIDTPGYADFIGEVVSGLAPPTPRSSPSTPPAASRPARSSPGIRRRRAAAAASLPSRAWTANTRTSSMVLDEVRDRFGVKVVPLAIPIGVRRLLRGHRPPRQRDARHGRRRDGRPGARRPRGRHRGRARAADRVDRRDRR